MYHSSTSSAPAVVCRWSSTHLQVVVRQRRHVILRGVVGCLALALMFYLLDAKHPKSSLYCTRHAVMPDNELEALEGLHVEDIDCSLIVRPTRTALDLKFFEEIPYSFEIVSAHLIRPPKRPPDLCRQKCAQRIEACFCRENEDVTFKADTQNRAKRRTLRGFYQTWKAEGERFLQEGEEEVESRGGILSERYPGDRGGNEHHFAHWGVNDVATLVLEDNQGNTYEFYTFQDEDVAERMLAKVEAFIREAREGVANEADGNTIAGGGQAEQAPLELEVLYDDSWLDEMACALFLLMALALMTRPYAEVVEFDAESGAMALDRRNLFQCGVFRYSCALENVSKLEITEADVWIMSAHAFEQLRQRKEFGLRMLFSLPLGGPVGGTTASISRSSIEAASSSSTMPAEAGGGGSQAGNTLPHLHTPPSLRVQMFRRCWLFMRRFFYCFGGEGWGCGTRRPVTRSPSTGGNFMYLELGFGKKAQDDRKLRRPVELVNDLLLRFSSDMEAMGGRKKEHSTDGNCCVCIRRRARVVTFPCMHMAVCPQCSESLSVCPLCRAGISERHTVFL